MAEMILNNVSLSYPIYGTSTRSLKNQAIRVATGGILKSNDDKAFVIEALKNVSFHLKPGDRLGLVGHNGAGKSTLLKVLLGVYEPTVGEVSISGRIGALLDMGMGMDPEATGYENIKIKALLLGFRDKEIQDCIPEIEAFTEMASFLSMPVKTYSAGMMVRLAFAISTMIVPDILLLDEAIGAGDAHFMHKAEKRMLSLIQQAKIMVFASHSRGALEQFCNKALWLEHGEVKMLSDVKSVLDAYDRRSLESAAELSAEETPGSC